MEAKASCMEGTLPTHLHLKLHSLQTVCYHGYSESALESPGPHSEIHSLEP